MEKENEISYNVKVNIRYTSKQDESQRYKDEPLLYYFDIEKNWVDIDYYDNDLHAYAFVDTEGRIIVRPSKGYDLNEDEITFIRNMMIKILK
jgi:hypothetical protein